MSTFVEFNADMVHFGPHKKKPLDNGTLPVLVRWYSAVTIMGRIAEVLGKSIWTVGRAAIYKSIMPDPIIVLEIVVDSCSVQKRQ